MRADAEGTMTPLDRKREIRKIMSGVDIIVNQCIRFAVNRGIDGELRDRLDEIKERAKEVGVGRRNRRVRQFRYRFLQTTSECEGWCEKNKLLYYVGDVFEDVTEEVWNAALAAGRRKYIQDHPETMTRPKRLPPPSPARTPEPDDESDLKKIVDDEGPLSKKFHEFMRREEASDGDPKPER